MYYPTKEKPGIEHLADVLVARGLYRSNYAHTEEFLDRLKQTVAAIVELQLNEPENYYPDLIKEVKERSEALAVYAKNLKVKADELSKREEYIEFCENEIKQEKQELCQMLSVETSEAKDRVRMAEYFKNLCKKEGKVHNYAYTMGLAAILSGSCVVGNIQNTEE